MQKDLVTRRFHTTFIIIQYILESPNVRQQGIWLNFIKVDTMDTMQSLNTLLKLHFYCAYCYTTLKNPALTQPSFSC